MPKNGGTFVFKTYDPLAVTATPADEEVQNWRWVTLTDASCQEGPYADQFYDLLQNAQTIVFVQDMMIIVSMDDTGTPMGTLALEAVPTE